MKKDMKKQGIYYNASDISEILQYSKAQGYRIIRQLNDELKAKGFFVRPGLVSVKYFNERYGM